MPRTDMAIRSAELTRRRYTVRCSVCVDLVIHTHSAHQAARVVEAHERDCTGKAVAHPHPDRDRRTR